MDNNLCGACLLSSDYVVVDRDNVSALCDCYVVVAAVAVVIGEVLAFFVNVANLECERNVIVLFSVEICGFGAVCLNKSLVALCGFRITLSGCYIVTICGGVSEDICVNEGRSGNSSDFLEILVCALLTINIISLSACGSRPFNCNCAGVDGLDSS